jgi:hypothetical protein
MNDLPAKKNDILILCSILIVAFVLRLWNFSGIPFMADELSALARTNFDSFHDLINKGARIDGHPVGVQVFLYYWIKLFGNKEITVKLPFIVSGIFAIYFSYKIATVWFNKTVGFITSAFMAGLQYTVMYSQIARPYISGLFFSVLMVWCWTNLLFGSKTKQKKWWIGYVLSGALCAYDHHFALLFAAIVGFTGLLFVRKDNWKMYVLSGLCIFILYIPHLSIFFFQLSMGGVGGADGWLGKPDSAWLLTYIKYIFHFSTWIYALVVVVMMISFIKISDNLRQKQKFRIIAFAWFFSIFIIGYFYSVKVNPVLQSSSLIFVFPFLLIFLFSLIKEMDFKFNIIITAIILISTSCSLIFERNHYKIFYRQPFEQFVTQTIEAIDKIGDADKATIGLFVTPYARDYYFKKYKRSFDFIYYNAYEGKIEAAKFSKLVNTLSTDYFISGNLPSEYIQVIKEKYPYILMKDEGFTYTFYCFAKTKPKNELHENVLFSKKSASMISPVIMDMTDSAMRNFYYRNADFVVDRNVEFVPSALTLNLKDVVNTRYCMANISVDIAANDTCANPILVIDLSEGNEKVDWVGSNFKSYYLNGDTSTRVILTRMLSNNQLKMHPEAVLKILVWNKTKTKIKLSNFKFEVIESNPYIYGLYE